MKYIYSIAVLLYLVVSAGAQTGLTNVSTGLIGCLFNTNCTNFVEESVTPITLPGTTGTGFIENRVIAGESGSFAEGLYGYLYRINLSNVVATSTNGAACVTNQVRCITNRVFAISNLVTCRTNLVGPTNVAICITNRFAPTNVVFCLTNFVPATNIVTCFSNAAGLPICFTNVFPATNLVLCFTNRLPGGTNLICATNLVPARTVVSCSTNFFLYLSNAVACVTNRVPCAPAACVDSLRINFGPVVGLFGDSLLSPVGLVVTNGATSGAPARVEIDGRFVTFRFDTPICPGEASLVFGLVSERAPRNVSAVLDFNRGADLNVLVRGPGGPRVVIDCDFDELLDAIGDLPLSAFTGPNDNARQARRTALLHRLGEIENAAQAGDADGALGGARALLKKIGEKNGWVTERAGEELKDILEDLINCLRGNGSDDDDDDDDHDDDDNDDKDGGKGHGKGRKENK